MSERFISDEWLTRFQLGAQVEQLKTTIETLKAIADAIGHELPADYRTMTNEPRAGELLPEHLVAQVGSTEGH